MSNEDAVFLMRINEYAEKVMGDIDPQKVQISAQLEKLRPIMQTLAMEQGMPVEEIFIKYMDLASEAAIAAEKKFEEKMGPDFDFEIR